MSKIAMIAAAVALASACAHDADWAKHHTFSDYKMVTVCTPNGAETICSQQMRKVP